MVLEEVPLIFAVIGTTGQTSNHSERDSESESGRGRRERGRERDNHLSGIVF